MTLWRQIPEGRQKCKAKAGSSSWNIHERQLAKESSKSSWKKSCPSNLNKRNLDNCSWKKHSPELWEIKRGGSRERRGTGTAEYLGMTGSSGSMWRSRKNVDEVLEFTWRLVWAWCWGQGTGAWSWSTSVKTRTYQKIIFIKDLKKHIKW